jgi:threonine/homoserine/homoserine lactone efflux protein
MLDFTDMITFVVALGVAALIPGPGMTALVARSVSSGATVGFAMLGGLIMGDLLYLSFAVFGLAILAQSFSILFIIIKWAAVAYLCYLAWVFWNTKHQAMGDAESPKRKDLIAAGLSGFTITLGNPKTIAFYLALLPVVINLELITLQAWAGMLVPLTISVLLVVGSVFIFGAIGVRHALSKPSAQRVLHRGAATAMILAAGSMALKEL